MDQSPEGGKMMTIAPDKLAKIKSFLDQKGHGGFIPFLAREVASRFGIEPREAAKLIKDWMLYRL